MCAFSNPITVPWDGAEVEDDILHWCSRDCSTPGRDPAEAWVLHASQAWSTENVELDPELAAAMIVRSFRELSGAPMPGFMSAHRWRYAQPEISSPATHIWRADYALGVCGEWCGGGTVEAAWRSGQSIVHALGE